MWGFRGFGGVRVSGFRVWGVGVSGFRSLGVSGFGGLGV